MYRAYKDVRARKMMIEFFGGKYRICRQDSMNITVNKKHVREKDETILGRLCKAGIRWKVEGYHPSVEDALSAVYDDMLSELVADDTKMVELDKFKRNIVKIKRLIIAKMKETVKNYIEMEREYEAKEKGPARKRQE